MLTHRSKAIIIGIFYIVAAVSSVIAVLFYDPILSNDWTNIAAANQSNQLLWGVIMDVILILTVIGTTAFLSPYLWKVDPHLTLVYYSTRFMEAVFIGIGVVSVLVLVSLGQAPDPQSFQNQGLAWQSIHRWTMVLGPNLMLGVNTFTYSLLLAHSQLVPKKLAQFGILTAIMVFLSGLLDFFGIIEPWSTLKGLISLPVGVYEISLAIYLIAKGFKHTNPQAK